MKGRVHHKDPGHVSWNQDWIEGIGWKVGTRTPRWESIDSLPEHVDCRPNVPSRIILDVSSHQLPHHSPILENLLPLNPKRPPTQCWALTPTTGDKTRKEWESSACVGKGMLNGQSDEGQAQKQAKRRRQVRTERKDDGPLRDRGSGHMSCPPRSCLKPGPSFTSLTWFSWFTTSTCVCVFLWVSKAQGPTPMSCAQDTAPALAPRGSQNKQMMSFGSRKKWQVN